MQNGERRIVQPRLLIAMIDAATATMQATAVWVVSLAGSVLAGTPILALTQTSPEVPMGSETALIRWAIEQGGLVVALALLFWVYRKDAREALVRTSERERDVQARLLDLLKERDGLIKELREQNDDYKDLLKENTRAITQLTTAIEDSQAERFPPRTRLSAPKPLGG